MSFQEVFIFIKRTQTKIVSMLYFIEIANFMKESGPCTAILTFMHYYNHVNRKSSTIPNRHHPILFDLSDFNGNEGCIQHTDLFHHLTVRVLSFPRKSSCLVLKYLMGCTWKETHFPLEDAMNFEKVLRPRRALLQRDMVQRF